MKVKNRIKLFITIITLVIILFTSGGVIANSDISSLKTGSGKDKIGQVLSLGFNDTLNKSGDNGAYCIQKGKSLHSERRNYTVSAYVELDGNLATVYNSKNSSEGNLIIDNLNGQVAYILSKNQGYGEVDNNTDAQNALWHIVNGWTQSLFGTSDYTCANNANVSENQLNREAIEYANKVGGDVALTEEEQNKKVVDKTKKDELSASIEEGYIRVGPFRWEFGGTLESITVKGDNKDLSSSDVRFVKYSGTTANIVKASEILTGEAFYVDISTDAGVSKLTGLTLKTSLDTPSKQIYTAKIWFLTSTAYQNIIYVDIGSSKSTPSVGEGSYDVDVENSIDIQLKKVDDRDITKPLAGVGFTFSTTIQTYDKVGEEKHYKNVSCTHKIKDAYKDSNGVEHEAEYEHSYDTVLDWTQYKYEWTDHTMYLNNDTWSEESSIYYTDKDGLISIENIKFPTKTIKNESSKDDSYTSTARLKPGENIVAKEVSNPHYGYTVGNTYNISLDSGKQVSNKTITNHQKLVKLSGYVWIDSNSGKLTMRQEEFESGEKGKDGIKVYLRDRNGTPVKEDTTREQNLYSEIQGGEYQFTDVDLDALERGDYYVEFEYCGIYYQSVSPNLNINNGSKAIDTSTRNVLDSKFEYVNASGSNTLQIRDVTVDYKKADEHVKEINYCTGCNVYARTNEAGYNLYSGFTPTSEEIRYVNLGLYEKPQTDYALAQDLHNVSVSVNEKSHIYKYAKARFASDGNNIDENKSTWNVGVKFQNNNGTYNRAIYHADAWYENQQDRGKEIKVRVTYKVALKNESTYLGRINSIVDYCDKRFTLIKVGTSIDDKYNIGGTIGLGNRTDYNNEYAKYVIDVNSIIKPTETNYIYLQFEIDRAGVLSIMNDKDLFNNVAEINSYTTFKDNNINKPVAVIDKDSVPGNIVPGQIKTYEDDTDAARSLKLELKNARAIEGTVFVDNPLNINKDSLNTGKERKGNGIFDNGETKLSGIKVTLRNTNNQPAQIYDEAEGKWKEATAVTDNDGNFKISGYLPGNYILTYTWGNKDYRVQYYKGTIYDENRNQSNKFWYKEDVNTRKTDALDDSKIRKEIETEMKGITTNILETEINKAYNGESSKITKTSMDSSTPEMEFSVEYETTVTDGTLEKVEFIVNNIDFGIIERPIQQLELSKRVSAFKITLANGQVLADARITENGTLEGLHNNTIYMGPTAQNSGMVKIEVDDELIQGATLETTYIMEVKNVGELDYTSDRYYYYGNSTGAEVVTASVTGLIDYVDGRLSIIDNNDGVWVEKDANYLINEVTVSEKDNETYINSNRAYLTEKLSKDLEPGDSNEVSLRTSKLLTSTEDNTFNNKSEIVKVNKNTNNVFSIGSPVKVFETVGKINQFHFNVSDAEKIIIVPSTGEDKSYVIPTIIGITSLLVLGVGIFVIKKFMIDNK